MVAMVDIRYEEILKAVEKIEKKKGICKILPCARFAIMDGGDQFMFDGLVCDDRMGGKQTGVSAEWCENCIKKQKGRNRH